VSHKYNQIGQAKDRALYKLRQVFDEDLTLEAISLSEWSTDVADEVYEKQWSYDNNEDF